MLFAVLAFNGINWVKPAHMLLRFQLSFLRGLFVKFNFVDIKLASKKRKLHNVGEPKKRHKGCDDDAEPRRRSRRRSSIDDCVIIGDVTSDEAPNEGGCMYRVADNIGDFSGRHQ